MEEYTLKVASFCEYAVIEISRVYSDTPPKYKA